MAEPRLELIKAVIFDIGETIEERLEFSPSHYHLQFVRQACGDAYTFSDEEILAAIRLSDAELLTRIGSLDPPVDYLITDEDWLFRAQVLFKELGLTEGICARATGPPSSARGGPVRRDLICCAFLHLYSIRLLFITRKKF